MKKTILIIAIISLCILIGCYYIPQFAQVIAMIETILMSTFICMVIIPMMFDHRIKED